MDIDEGESLGILVLSSEFLLEHICWLDLASTFLYLPHDFQLFRSLPDPDDPWNIHMDIYSDI
jgi:hypothetical protein